MGGPAHQVALLSGRRFHPDRYETLLVHGALAPGEESAAHLSEAEGARLRYLPTLGQPLDPRQDPRALADLIRLIRSYRPHIVHTHTAKAGFVGRQAALMSGRRAEMKLVHTFHGHVLEGYFGAAKNRLFRGLEHRLAKRTDALVGVSDATVEDLVRLGVAPPEKIRRIPLGLDLDRVATPPRGARQRLRTELGFTDEEVVCVFVGRLVPIKRLDVLLRAFADALGRSSKCRLLIVGDGEERAERERMATELGIAGRVIFYGYSAELAKIFAASDVAVLSSDNEGTPVSLIEAGAAGLPAVATDVGGVGEVVGDAGATVPREDHRALGIQLARLADDAELRRRRGEAARERAYARYGADRLVDDIDQLYEELLAGRTSANVRFL